jgi:hypothetical protein
MRYVYSIGELSGQNWCMSRTRNIESNTHGLREVLLFCLAGANKFSDP